VTENDAVPPQRVSLRLLHFKNGSYFIVWSSPMSPQNKRKKLLARQGRMVDGVVAPPAIMARRNGRLHLTTLPRIL
jgi:hypothetical protein